MLNLLATPGLGSLVARRWLAGLGQLLLAIFGCILMGVWFVREMNVYYGLMFNGQEAALPELKPLKVGTLLFLAAWFWSAVTSLSLVRQASAGSLQSLKNTGAPPIPKLDPAQIAVSLPLVPQWQQRGDAIARTYQFKDFPAAVKFVNALAELAEEAWHHPDIDVRWNKVTLTLTTHDAGGLTQKDFDLARQFDRLSLR